MDERTDFTMKNLIDRLSSSDDLVRTGACKSLIAIGSPAVPFLVEALKNPDYLVRWEAAKALTAIGDPSSAPALVQALEDEEFEVRWRAAEGVAKMGVDGLVPLFQALIKDGGSVSLREVAHHILHNVATGELRGDLLPVLAALESTWPSVEIPAAALRAMERIEELQKTHEEKGTGSLKGGPAGTWHGPADLGARSRTRRYARSLQHRAI